MPSIQCFKINDLKTKYQTINDNIIGITLVIEFIESGNFMNEKIYVNIINAQFKVKTVMKESRKRVFFSKIFVGSYLFTLFL